MPAPDSLPSDAEAFGKLLVGRILISVSVQFRFLSAVLVTIRKVTEVAREIFNAKKGKFPRLAVQVYAPQSPSR